MPLQPQPVMTARDWMILLFLGGIWGSSFLFANIAVREIPPLTLVFLRIAIAAFALCLVMVARRMSFRPFFEMTGAFFVLGLLNSALPWFLIFQSQLHLGPGMGGILNAVVPVITVVLAHFLTRDEKISGLKVFSILAGFTGVVVLIGPHVIHGFGTAVGPEMMGLGASFVYALGGIYARRFKNLPSLVTATGGFIAGAIYTLPLSIFIDHSYALPFPSLSTVACVMSLALLSTALAFVMFYKLLARVGATDASLVAFVIPVSAILLGVIFRGEVLTLAQLGGMVLVAFSLLLLDGRLFRKKPITAAPDIKLDESRA